jgi:predicted ribosomally synthesized peptide with nif11-like leader
MSLEQAKKFIKRMKTEEAFRSNIMAVEDVADRQKLAKAEGYEFTEEEIKSVSAELSDAAMNSVSAGGNMPIRE